MRQTYKKHKYNVKNLRKAGSRIATVRRLAESMSMQVNPNFDLNPFVLEPEASTVIKRSFKKHMNKKAYTRATVRFYTNLVLFKNVLLTLNPREDSKALAISSLLNSIPVGRTLEAFLEVPGVVPNITRLRETLSDADFSFPERDTRPYIELKGLIDEIIRLIKVPLQGRIEIPLIIQRQERVEMFPAGTLNLGEGRIKSLRIKSLRIKRRRNKSLRNKSLRNKSLRNKSLRNKRRK